MSQYDATTITFADPDGNAVSLESQIAHAFSVLRQWYPKHTLKVTPSFTGGHLTSYVTWDVSAIRYDFLHGAGRNFPHSYGKRNIDEALADMKEQARHFFDLVTVNADLANAAMEEAIWCADNPRPVYDYQEAQ
jgi:hypothetical protein